MAEGEVKIKIKKIDGPMFDPMEIGGPKGFFAKRVTKSKQPKDETLGESVGGVDDLAKKLESWRGSLLEADRGGVFGRAFALGSLAVVKMGNPDPVYVIFDDGNFYLFIFNRISDIQPNKEARQKYGYFRGIFLPPYPIQFNPTGFKQYASKMIKVLEKDEVYCGWLARCARAISGPGSEKSGYVSSFPAFPPASVALFGHYGNIVDHVKYWNKSHKATDIIKEEMRKAIDSDQIISFANSDVRNITGDSLWDHIMSGNAGQYFFSGHAAVRK